jgi:SAM-dependent methyltransferase
MPASNSTTRFSDRVDNYVRYRPGYPPQVLETLKHACGLNSEHRVADIASGTGIWTRLLLENGNRVFGIEPNDDMREAAERLLSGFLNFNSIAATAEATTLPDHSVDFVTAAQAAHWFNRGQARQEFARISFHMTPEQFRRHGHAVVDWISDYYANLESYPVLSPGRARTDTSLAAGRAAAPGRKFRSHARRPRAADSARHHALAVAQFFAFFPANASGPSILGDLLSSGLGVQGMLWATSPACTELETHVLDWLAAHARSAGESSDRRDRAEE